MNDEDPKKKITDLFRDTQPKVGQGIELKINIPGNNNVVTLGDHTSISTKHRHKLGILRHWFGRSRQDH